MTEIIADSGLVFGEITFPIRLGPRQFVPVLAFTFGHSVAIVVGHFVGVRRCAGMSVGGSVDGAMKIRVMPAACRT